jgi:hypothetical protein
MSVGEVDSLEKFVPSPENGWLLGEDQRQFVCVRASTSTRRTVCDPDAAIDVRQRRRGGPNSSSISEQQVPAFYFDDEINQPQPSNDIPPSKNETAFIPDSGWARSSCSISPRRARRVLDNHPSTKAEEITFTFRRPGR